MKLVNPMGRQAETGANYDVIVASKDITWD